MSEPSVLVVEDDHALREVLAMHLGAEGFAVRAAASGEDALSLCAQQIPHVVVLDLGLPGLPGLELCAALHERFRPTPGVVIVTAQGSEADVLLGFDRGADDYVVKPFRPREVVARVRALLRRMLPAMEATPEVLSRGALRIEVATQRVTVHARPVSLTATELALLVVMARSPDVVHSRAALLEKVWDTTHAGYARNVDCHVARVRRKLEAAGLASVITTVHGAGYRFTGGS